jgi:hypothetical protein
MHPRLERLYAKKYAPEAYRKEIQGMVRVLQDRYRLQRRPRIETKDDSGADAQPEQIGFRW